MQVILDSSFRPPGFSPLGSPLCGAGRKESSGTGLRAKELRKIKTALVGRVECAEDIPNQLINYADHAAN